MTYCEISPIESRVEADRQGAKRHYGVHPYFTRRPYNVVAKYVTHYSRKRDLVLDPFGGSGVTAVEAFLNNRTGIQNDINPLANFIAQGILDLSEGELDDLKVAAAHVIAETKPIINAIYNSDDWEQLPDLTTLRLPENIALPKSADVSRYYELFTKRHLFSLAVIKRSIDSLKDRGTRQALLLAWSASLAKLNKTFLSAEGRVESRGGSSIFSIYRYKVAKSPVELSPLETFQERTGNIINAKAEIQKIIEFRQRQGEWCGRFEVFAEDVFQLEKRFSESVDYIFTDPPYGAHISYLDLSVLWNSWLGQIPKTSTRNKELIVGGELGFSEAHYIERLGESIRSCMRMLRPERWLSVVFQHWNIRYFEAILTAAQESGGELMAAVSQVGDPIWSMHKKKNKDSVLSGEMILTFFKSKSKSKRSVGKPFDLESKIDELLSEAGNRPIFGEYLFNQLVLDAWKSSSIEELNIDKATLSQVLETKGWHYDPNNHYWILGKIGTSSLFPA